MGYEISSGAVGQFDPKMYQEYMESIRTNRQGTGIPAPREDAYVDKSIFANNPFENKDCVSRLDRIDANLIKPEHRNMIWGFEDKNCPTMIFDA